MFINDWKRDLLTIPNLLSLSRILLIPVYTAIYLQGGQYSCFWAAGILALSCLTDMFDGMIARRFDMISNVGKLLDPLADKLTQLSLIVSLSIRHPVLRGVLILFLAKELFQATVAYAQFRRGKVLPGALISGKVCTCVLFVSFILLILVPALPQRVITAIAVTDTAFLAYAFIGYFFAFLGRNHQLHNWGES